MGRQGTAWPERGAGAYQFTGHTLYVPLLEWESNIATRPGKLIPGLASEWKSDAQDPKKCTFTSSKRVKFHNRSDFNADAVLENLEKVLDDKSAQFDAEQPARFKPRIRSIASSKKTSDFSVEMTTKSVDLLFPYHSPWFLIFSPVGKDGPRWPFSPR